MFRGCLPSLQLSVLAPVPSAPGVGRRAQKPLWTFLPLPFGGSHHSESMAGVLLDMLTFLQARDLYFCMRFSDF